MANVLVALRHAQVVLVQDALEIAPQYPDHPVFARLLAKPEFKALLQEYQEKKAAGVRQCVGVAVWWQR